MKKILIITFCFLVINNLIAQKKDTNIILTPFTENTLNKNGIVREWEDHTLFTLNNLKRYKCKYLSAFIRGVEPYNYSEESKNPYFKIGLGAEKMTISVHSFHKYILVCNISNEYINLTSQWIERDLEIDEYFFENQKYRISLKDYHTMRITRKLDSITKEFNLIESKIDEDCN